jgi:uncharacterized membrane protein
MPTYRVTQRVNAPAETVWRILSDVLAWPEWLSTVTNVSLLEGEALQPGSKFKVAQPKLHPVVWQVTTLKQGQCFTWESTNPGTRLWANHIVRAISPEESEVELQFRFSGPFGIPLGWVAGPITRKYIASEAASLKCRAESCARRASERSGPFGSENLGLTSSDIHSS